MIEMAHAIDWNVKEYYYDGHVVHWGRDLVWDELVRLNEGEVFLLVDEHDVPISSILMDSYNQIRESTIKDFDPEELRRY